MGFRDALEVGPGGLGVFANPVAYPRGSLQSSGGHTGIQVNDLIASKIQWRGHQVKRAGYGFLIKV